MLIHCATAAAAAVAAVGVGVGVGVDVAMAPGGELTDEDDADDDKPPAGVDVFNDKPEPLITPAMLTLPPPIPPTPITPPPIPLPPPVDD